MYRRNRYYDPNTGQFTQEDPLGLGRGHECVWIRERRPGISYVDPFGLGPEIFEQLGEAMEDDGPEIQGAVEQVSETLQESFEANKEGVKEIYNDVLQANRKLGNAGENAVSRMLGGLSKNTQKLNGRIPDFWDKARNTVVEVKNTAKLSFTRQLHEMQAGAEDLEQKFELFVPPGGGTKLSGPL